eukprot:5191632-Amphidinium_carterae.1
MVSHLRLSADFTATVQRHIETKEPTKQEQGFAADLPALHRDADAATMRSERNPDNPSETLGPG